MTTGGTKTGKGLERRVAQAYRDMGARKVEHDVELEGHQIDLYVELGTADRGLQRKMQEGSHRSRAMSTLKTVTLLAAIVLAALFPAQAASGSSPGGETYVFVTAWDNAPPPGTFNDAHGIAVGPNGDVYVADTDNYRIQRFSADGEFITEWGERGWAHGEFWEPVGVAVDDSGKVYVLDFGYLHIFASDGAFLDRWHGVTGQPVGSVDVDAQGNVYVVWGMGELKKYDPSGQLIKKWSAGGDGVAVDRHNGYVYTSDSSNQEIQKFDLDGRLLTSWSHYFANRGLAVDSVGRVYAIWENSVIIYDDNGARIGQWGTRGDADGQLKWPRDLATAPDGSVYVNDAGNHRIQKLTHDGDFITKWGSETTGSKLRHPEGIGIGADGNIFVADAEAHRVQSFTSEGIFLTTWNTMDYPSGVSTDANGHIYVCGPGVPYVGTRTIWGTPSGIRKYTSAGAEVARWGHCCSSEDGRTDWASGVAVGPDGNVYVADTKNDRIQKFAPDGTYLSKWGNRGIGDGQFNEPEGVAVAPDGSVYVADTGNDRIQRFSSDGVFLGKWGSNGSGDGQFRDPKGIAVDTSGYVYVVEISGFRVQKFTPQGVFVTKWGSYGQGNGQFEYPMGIAVDLDGYVYVADTDNNRIQKFERAAPRLSGSAKLVDKSVAQPGDALHYTIILNNSGSLDAAQTSMTDALPPSTTYDVGSLWASSGSYNESDGVVTWAGTVTLRVPVTVTFSVSINAPLPKGTRIINTATIDDGVNPEFGRTATTMVNPYQLYLPVALKGRRVPRPVPSYAPT